METIISDGALLQQLMTAFGLRQNVLGYLLGLSSGMMNHVVCGRRSLPASSYVPFTKLLVALDKLPPELALAPPGVPAPPRAPDPLSSADKTALGHHQLACWAKVMNLRLRQTALETRAAWATRRLAAMPTLISTLPDPTAPLPSWLQSFEAEAREVLADSGPLAQARLALRRATLLHEMGLVHRLVAGEPLEDVVPPAVPERPPFSDWQEDPLAGVKPTG